ncbi:MAG: tyrosine-type recombinase/integrase, partial [Mycobacteriales bacterium]
FIMHKMGKEHRQPIDDVTLNAIRHQQELVRRRLPHGTPWLFPRLKSNSDGLLPFSRATLIHTTAQWVARCDVRDGAGQPVKVTPHQFRHTLGTRMINEGVPQHVVQDIYGHESSDMTAHYARLTDKTKRAAFDTWSARRVNVAGQAVSYDPAGPTADAQWMKERLGRAKQTLANGDCGRPLQQECPHPNACLTCPDFLTDERFLDQHRRQLARTGKLIARAEANGQFRMAEMNRKVEANLTNIITGLEQLQGGHDDG